MASALSPGRSRTLITGAAKRITGLEGRHGLSFAKLDLVMSGERPVLAAVFA